MNIDTGQDVTGFQDFTTECPISSLSQRNHELVTDTILAHWHCLFCVNQKCIPSNQTRTAPVQSFSKN